jgi:hypothetical protein
MEVFQVGHLVGIPSERVKTETGTVFPEICFVWNTVWWTELRNPLIKCKMYSSQATGID